MLTILSAFAAASVYYYPDHTHLVTVAPLWFVLAAESLDALLRRLEWRPWLPGVAAAALALVFLGALGSAMYRSMTVRRVDYPISYETAFGRVDLTDREEIHLIEALEPLLRESGTREIFIFPCYASLYLHTRTSNPTRFQILIPGYSGENHVREVISMLESRQVRYVVRNFYWRTEALGPLLDYLRQHYEAVARFPEGRRVPIFTVLRRKDVDRGSPASRG